jgi:hypothetical protein
MSNMSNSTAIGRIFADVPTIAYSLAMGKDGMTDAGDRLFRAVLSDPDVDADIPRQLYEAIYAEACAVGLAKKKPYKEQTAKSRSSQVSKFANFMHAAQFAQDNEHVVPVYEWLRGTGEGELGVSGYTKVVACLTAMKAVLMPKPQADKATLVAAVKASLTDKPKLASAAVEEIGAAWEKLAHGDAKTGEHPYQAEFALLEARIAGLSAKIAADISTVQVIFARIEAEKAERIALAKTGLSV